LDLLSVIRLSAFESSGERPIMEVTSRVGWGQSSLVSGPKPSVNVLGEEIGTVASVEVTKSARSPEIGHVTIDESLDPVVFGSRLEAHQVHATFPAVVSGIEPIPLSVPDTWVVVQPGEEIQVVAKPLNSTLVHSVSAKKAIGEAKLASSLVRISAAVVGEQIINTSGLRALGAVVGKRSAAAKNLVNAAHHPAEKVLHRLEKVSKCIEKLGIGGSGDAA